MFRYRQPLYSVIISCRMFLLGLLREHRRVIVSCRNSGFGDNLLAAANAWYYAKNTHRALVIYWFHSRYIADIGENAFTHFFTIPASIDGVPVIADYRLDRLSDFLLRHPDYLLPRPDPILFLYGILKKLGIGRNERHRRRMLSRQEMTDGKIEALADADERIIITHGCYSPHLYLKPFFDSLVLKEEYLSRAEAFWNLHLKGKKVIGVHIRYYSPDRPFSFHTDYWLDHAKALSECMDKIQKAAASLGQSEHVIFLCTDSRMVNDFISRSLENVVTYDKQFGTDVTKELHDELPVETAAATVIEMFLLARSDVLVRFPPGSWFSHYASLYVEEIIS